MLKVLQLFPGLAYFGRPTYFGLECGAEQDPGWIWQLEASCATVALSEPSAGGGSKRRKKIHLCPRPECRRRSASFGPLRSPSPSPTHLASVGFHQFYSTSAAPTSAPEISSDPLPQGLLGWRPGITLGGCNRRGHYQTSGR